MANQYRVMPLESTSTCWPPMVFAVTVFPPAAAGALLLLLPPAAGVLATVPELLLPELAQADTVRAKAARPAAPHIFRIGISPLHSACALPLEITCDWSFQFTASSLLVSSRSAGVGRRQPELAADDPDRVFHRLIGRVQPLLVAAQLGQRRDARRGAGQRGPRLVDAVEQADKGFGPRRERERDQLTVEPALGDGGGAQVGPRGGQVAVLHVIVETVELVVELAVGRLRDGHVLAGHRPELGRCGARAAGR